MSTSGVTLRWPQRARRSTIQAGVAACVLTFSITRPEKRPHRSGALTLTGSTLDEPTATGAMAGVVSGVFVSADSSRATP